MAGEEPSGAGRRTYSVRGVSRMRDFVLFRPPIGYHNRYDCDSNPSLLLENPTDQKLTKGSVH